MFARLASSVSHQQGTCRLLLHILSIAQLFHCRNLCLQVDGFRFDIMGHHFIHNMTAIRNALNSLKLDKDGVDGRHIYIYGEAWDFGEVALNQRGRNASQHNLGGSRIGAFNDR